MLALLRGIIVGVDVRVLGFLVFIVRRILQGVFIANGAAEAFVCEGKFFGLIQEGGLV